MSRDDTDGVTDAAHGLTRRAALTAGLTAGLVVAGLAPAAPASAAGTPHGLTRDPLLHLLRRTTYGLTPQLVAEARALGAQAWLEQQLHPRTLDDRVCDAVLRRFPTVSQTPAQILAGPLGDRPWDAAQELVRAAVARAVWSKRQLFELMVEFWSDHLHVTTPSDGVGELRSTDDREVVRKHALGRFSDMLVASATSPSMLRYLDGASSRKESPNENYGRELLELHTVGVEAGYTEAEVRDSALVLTGLTVDGASRAFRYRPEWHHVGPVSVLGFSHDNASAAQGLDVAKAYLRYLASHPSTARRLARKLCVRFVSDDPPAALVERLALVYLQNDTAVVPVLRALFASPEFAGSVGQKQRRPFEDLVAVVRALGLGPDPDGGTEGVRALTWMLEARGHAPFGWHPPDGYPDVAAAWSSSAHLRGAMDDRLQLASGWWPKTLRRADLTALLPRTRPRTAGALVDALSRRLLGQVLVPAQRDAVLGFLGRRAGDRLLPDHTGWQLPYLVATLFDTPAWSAR